VDLWAAVWDEAWVAAWLFAVPLPDAALCFLCVVEVDELSCGQHGASSMLASTRIETFAIPDNTTLTALQKLLLSL
jgi:hypothetical protein